VSRRTIHAVFMNHDNLQPVVNGDVVPDELDIIIDRHTRPVLGMNDPGAQVVELSWSRYIRGLSRGNKEWVGIPLFPRRCFTHRAWYVRRDSGHEHFADLVGKTIGTNEWPATGNTWARAAAREQGVDIRTINWVVGSIDGGPTNSMDQFPEYVRPASPDVHLLDLLLTGELNALVCPVPPSGFYDRDAQVVRLHRDFRAVEQDYYHRTQIYPAHHIVGLRREIFEEDPAIAHIVFRTFETARQSWQYDRARNGDTSPWVMADIENSMDLMGYDWQPGGIEPNEHMTRALCHELLAQGLIENPVPAEAVFADFRESS
jgi:4,5-dihydroxyphthalate decarboxylase